MNSSEGDTVVLISHTGNAKMLVELSPLALDVPEDIGTFVPMTSHLAQLNLIDVLATGFTLWNSTNFQDNLKRLKYAIKESRFYKTELEL